VLLTTLLVVSTLMPKLEDGLGAARSGLAEAQAGLSRMGPAASVAPLFQPEARAVSNWRQEAGEALRPASLALVTRYSVTDPSFVARCVKLNNYWCIKRARWEGEIGADAEGHTGFASAAAGADAAALLLRRYYREFGRRTALSIVRRWAPAECRVAGTPAPAASATAPRVAPDIAPRGIQKTLRARYLARQGRGGAVKRVAVAPQGGLRVQPWSARARLGGQIRAAGSEVAKTEPKRPQPAKRVAAAEPAPNPGLLIKPSTIIAKPSELLVKPSVLLVAPSVLLKKPQERNATPAPARGIDRRDRFAAESASLPPIAAGLPDVPLLDLRLPAPVCANDETRIRNYAGRIAASAGLGMEDDLKLFAADGTPTLNLARVMLAMSGFELGTLRAAPALVDAAVARLAARPVAGASPEASAVP
jgi:hypothetical protein